jgi:Glucodextranase, domain B
LSVFINSINVIFIHKYVNIEKGGCVLEIELVLLLFGIIGMVVFSILGVSAGLKKDNKAKKKNFILSGVSLVAVIIAIIIASGSTQPTSSSVTEKTKETKKEKPLSLTMQIYSGNVEHDRKEANISGITDRGARVTVNGESIEVDDEGRFSRPFPLKDGKNDFTVLISKGGQEEIKNITINRETAEQMNTRLAAEENARKEAEAKKKAAEEAEKQKSDEEKEQSESEEIIEEVLKLSKQEMLEKIGELIDLKQAFDTGSYVKGEIPKGEYAFISFEGSGQYYSEEDPAGNIIDNENFDSFGYVYVHDAGNIETEGALISVNAFKSLGVSGAKEIYEIMNDVENYKDSAWYKVGTDIKPGQYVIESYGEGYVAVMTGPVGKSEIVDNENFNGKHMVNVKAGQYLNISNGVISQ